MIRENGAEAVFKIAESQMLVFSGGKRERESEGNDGNEFPVIASRREEWVHREVSGNGGWRGGLGGRGGRGGYRGPC